jgi:Zn finger protein HypA/HybF involved in hydrogenase expression
MRTKREKNYQAIYECWYCDREHTRKQSSYCCDSCEKAQEKELDRELDLIRRLEQERGA